MHYGPACSYCYRSTHASGRSFPNIAQAVPVQDVLLWPSHSQMRMTCHALLPYAVTPAWSLRRLMLILTDVPGELISLSQTGHLSVLMRPEVIKIFIGRIGINMCAVC